MITRWELLKNCERRLSDAGVDSPRLSAEVLLRHVLNIDRLEMMLGRFVEVFAKDRDEFLELVRRRELGEPVAYLIGSREFYGREFVVSPDVLIPRPETEQIIDMIVDDYPRDRVLNIVDVGTGSGILAITMALMYPNAKVIGVDVSRAALRIAQQNALKHCVDARIILLCASLLSSIKMNDTDLIVANLPYVPRDFEPSMDFEVVNFEPHMALFSGYDGLDLYRELFKMIGQMRSGSRMLCECDSSHASKLGAMGLEKGWSAYVRKDLSGRDRFVDVVF